MPKKMSKKWKKIFFFVLYKYQSVTHVSTCIFQGLFKNIAFRSVALVTKKLWAILDFFSQTGLFLKTVGTNRLENGLKSWNMPSPTVDKTRKDELDWILRVINIGI